MYKFIEEWELDGQVLYRTTETELNKITTTKMQWNVLLERSTINVSPY